MGASKLDARIIINEGISLAPNTSDCTDKFVGLDAQLPSEEDLLNSPWGSAGWLLRRGVHWRVLEKDIQGVPLVRFAILKGVKLELQPGLVPHFPQPLSQLTALLCGQALSKSSFRCSRRCCCSKRHDCENWSMMHAINAAHSFFCYLHNGTEFSTRRYTFLASKRPKLGISKPAQRWQRLWHLSEQLQ